MKLKNALCTLLLILVIAGSDLVIANPVVTDLGFGNTSNGNSIDPQIVSHKVTSSELALLQSREGIFAGGNDASTLTINRLGADSHPPTPKQWSQIASNAYLVDSIHAFDALPPNVDNSQTQWFPPIGVQNHGCNAFSVGYYIKTFQEAKEHNWNLVGAQWEGFASGVDFGHPTPSYQDKIMSPAFIYNLNDPTGSIESTMNVVCQIGDCTWATMPYDGNHWTDWPSKPAWIEAAQYRGNYTTGYQYIDLTTDAGLSNLKNYLASQNLVSIYVDANKLTKTNLGTQDLLTLDNYLNPTHNHVNTIVGYDDAITYIEGGATHSGAFKVANSWGAGVYSWENNPDGFYWVSYEAMKECFQTCLFYNDLIAYQPHLTASFSIVHSKRSDCTIDLGLNTPQAPTATKHFSDIVSGYPYPYTSNDYLPFPDNDIVVDITEFESYLPSINGQSFWLSVDDAGSTSTGSITSFSVNYQGSVQLCTTLPCQTVNYQTKSVTLTYPAASQFTVIPTAGPAGKNLALQGSGFTPYGAATILYRNPITNQWTTLSNNITVSSSGSFSYACSAPDLLVSNIAGDHTPMSDAILFQAYDNTTALTFEAYYTEMRRGLSWVNSYYANGLYGNNTDFTSSISVAVNDAIVIRGNWFRSGDISVFWDNDLISSALSSIDDNGGLLTIFSVPPTGAGTHTITLHDGAVSFCLQVTAKPFTPLFTVLNNVVYSYSPGTISAYNANSGTLLWTNQTSLNAACMTADQSTIYLATAQGLYAINSNASTHPILWSRTSNMYQSAYVLFTANGAVYECTLGGYFLALNPATGNVMGDTGYYGALTSGVTFANGVVYMSLLDGRLRAYTVPAASTVWRQDSYLNQIQWSSLAFENNKLFAGYSNSLAAFDPANGNPLWLATIPSASGSISLLAGNSRIYACIGSKIYALNPSDGSVIWQKETGSPIYCSALASGMLYLSSEDTVKAFNLNGDSPPAMSWYYQPGGRISYLTTANGIVYASSADGDINAITASNGQKVWDLLGYIPPSPTPSPTPTGTPPATAAPTTPSSTSLAATEAPTSKPSEPSPTPAVTTPTQQPTTTPTQTPTSTQGGQPDLTIPLIVAAVIGVAVALSLLGFKRLKK